MNYRNFCWSGRWLFVALVIFGLILVPACAGALPENSSHGVKGPESQGIVVITGTTMNSTMVRIRADQPCVPVIRYSPAPWFAGTGSDNQVISASLACTTHAIKLTGLEPDTRYHYLVSGCGAQGTEGSFSTFPVSGTCRFIVYGDSREQVPLYNQTERHKLVADRIADERDIRFVVNSGDLVADSTDAGEWSRFFDSTEKVRSMTTYYAVPGNHDTDRVLFRQLFGPDSADFFDCGDTRIVLIDSTDRSSVSLGDQAVWLKSALGASPGVKITILHHPAYSSDEKHYGGWQNIQQTLVPAFQESGVRLVFNSHVHAFEQVERNGITYITEARGGAPSYPLNSIRIPGSQIAYENTLGYSRVIVDTKARVIRIDVIRVADVSADLRTVTTIYPSETIDAHIRIPAGGPFGGFPDFSEPMCIFVKDNKGCRDPFRNRGTLFI